MYSQKAMQNNGLGWMKFLLVSMLLGYFTVAVPQAKGTEARDVSLSVGFHDGMTLAAYKMITVNGQAPAGITLDVKLVKDNTTLTMARVTSNRDGNWQVLLAEQEPGGPYQLKVSHGERFKVINDIYIGQADLKVRNPQGGIILSTRISDGMLLQPGENIALNGFAQPGRTIDIKLIKNSNTLTMARVQAGREGKWQVTMPGQKAGGPMELNVTDGSQTKMVKGIIIGQADIKPAPVAADELVVKKVTDVTKPIAKLREQLPKPETPKEKNHSQEINREFLQAQFDDTSWPMANLTSLDKMPKNETLIARKHVHFAIDPQVVSLSIGQENQIKQIYINGQVLETSEWQHDPMKIKVASGMFHSGDNVIALLSEKNWDNTRFIGTTGRFNLIIDQFSLELSSNWSVFHSTDTQEQAK
ncbi:MAG: hemoblobin-interacting domain-containing protein [Paraglaciecola polaris]|uniref:hemoblobin-interacting domain-containing protein n=1 Tax=Paraglaciecola polaris TaxID=222814 RepID=UPI0030010FFE